MCGHHLMCDASKFYSLENYGSYDATITADNTIHWIEKEGSVTFTNEGDSLTLENVYHVSRIRKTLFSIVWWRIFTASVRMIDPHHKGGKS